MTKDIKYLKQEVLRYAYCIRLVPSKFSFNTEFQTVIPMLYCFSSQNMRSTCVPQGVFALKQGLTFFPLL